MSIASANLEKVFGSLRQKNEHLCNIDVLKAT
jgi:hypothetical protein